MNLTLNNSQHFFGYITNGTAVVAAMSAVVAVEVMRVGGGKIEGDTGSLDGFAKSARSALAVRILHGSYSDADIIARMVCADTQFGSLFVVDENGSMYQPTDADLFGVIRRVWTEAASLPAEG